MNSDGKRPVSVTLVAFLVGVLAISNAPLFSYASVSPLTEFRFFLHDDVLTVSGGEISSSADALISPLLNAPANSFYGAFFDFDDSMTLLPDPSSEEIGRGRGMYLCAAKDTQGAGVEYVWTAQFNEASGHGDGTTLSFQGFYRYWAPVSEISIVGGTGMFKMARGWAEITTYSVVEFSEVLNITVYFTYGH
ncbi:unnamed protein product [Calypogeia fissa]